MKKIKLQKLGIICLIVIFQLVSIQIFAQKDADNSYVLAWDDVLALKVISASMKEESLIDAPSNITIITKEMIENRGYRSFVEVAQDIPGFDFLMYEDGGGDFSTFSINRGIGGQGNPRILILVDNIPQNFINNRWSVHWTFEQLLHDLDRIEIVHGPGSALYGGQAFTGVVHFITKKDYNGVYAKIGYGSNNEIDLQTLIGKKIGDDFRFSVSFRRYQTDGDEGSERYDPGNYFEDFYEIRDSGPLPLPQRFRIPYSFNRMESNSLRVKLSGKKTEVGFFYWNLDRAISSFDIKYQFQPQKNRDSHTMDGFHLYTRNIQTIGDKLTLESNMAIRSLSHERIKNLDQSIPGDSSSSLFSATGYQAYIDERLNLEINKNNNIIIGGRSQFNINVNSDDMQNKMLSNSSGPTQSSFSLKNEFAAFALWNNKINKYLAYSVGTRIDFGTDLKLNHSPRVSFIIKPTKKLNFKIIYGHAFRQPDTKEEFSTNQRMDRPNKETSTPELKTEKISTWELEMNFLAEKRFNIKANFFYSNMLDLLEFIPDTNVLIGLRASNIANYKVFGTSLSADYSPHKNIRIYSNYIYTQGKEGDDTWKSIDKVAAHKLNLGVNCLLWKKRINVNIRANIVSKRKVNADNIWLQLNENGYAPGYWKVNFTISYRGFKWIQPQFIVRNLFNEQFYGIGRHKGASLPYSEGIPEDVVDTDYAPSYHPQPGRTFTFLLKFEFNKKKKI